MLFPSVASCHQSHLSPKVAAFQHLALSAIWDVPAKHGDIPNAYEKAEKKFHLEILLHISQAMEVREETLKKIGATNKKEVVLELHTSLYGLKQAGRLWSQLLHARLLDAGFIQCQSDMCLCWKVDNGQLVVVSVYVDYLLATGTYTAAVERLFNHLGSLYIKDLGVVSKFLGMRVAMKDDGSYVLDQTEAIGELLREHGLRIRSGQTATKFNQKTANYWVSAHTVGVQVSGRSNPL